MRLRIIFSLFAVTLINAVCALSVYAQAPTITSFSPKHGPVGTVITIMGTNLTRATEVRHGGLSIPFVVNSTNGSLSATIPSNAFNTGLIRVSSPSGFAETGADIFAVFRITSVSPTSGPEGTQFIINGSGFSNQIFTSTFPNLPTANRVTIGGVAVPFTVLSFNQIRAIAFQSGVIAVQTPINSVTTTSTFTVTVPAPVITGFMPTSGPAGTRITVMGMNFAGVSGVTVGGVAAGYGIDNAGNLIVILPATGARTGVIVVTTITGGTGTSTQPFTVTTTSVRDASPEVFAARLFPQPPQNAQTTLEYTLAEPSEVRVEIVNALGMNGLSYSLGKQQSGVQHLAINTEGLSAGAYFVRLSAGGAKPITAMLPMLVVR